MLVGGGGGGGGGVAKIINRMANSADPDETAHYEPSHLDLHRLHSYLYRSVGLKGLKSP